MTPCVLWTGALKPNGYGQRTFRGRSMSAHRAAWIEAYGDIPEGMHVCHRCDVRACVRLDHLFLGTRSDNMRDMFAKGRAPSQRITHCPHGHEYTAANTYYDDRGCRRCKACRNVQQRARRKRQKEARDAGL